MKRLALLAALVAGCDRPAAPMANAAPDPQHTVTRSGRVLALRDSSWSEPEWQSWRLSGGALVMRRSHDTRYALIVTTDHGVVVLRDTDAFHEWLQVYPPCDSCPVRPGLQVGDSLFWEEKR